jgi:uncharacterized protein YjiK
MFILLFILLVALVGLFVFQSKNKSKGDFKIEKPDAQQYLSGQLKEISGISYYAENQVICINDEQGLLFIYDYQKEQIVDTLEFSEEGDYEDLAYHENKAYVLRSDGQITVFDTISKTSTTIDCRQDKVQEYEGLCHDASANSLLLAAKEMEGEKTIFQYDLMTEKLSEKFNIGKDDISKNGKHGKEFKPSGIAIQPLSNNIYVLASAGKKLLIYGANGILKHQYNLDEDQFPQPEGICFTPNGDLIISSEGKSGKASISIFGKKNK